MQVTKCMLQFPIYYYLLHLKHKYIIPKNFVLKQHQNRRPNFTSAKPRMRLYFYMLIFEVKSYKFKVISTDNTIKVCKGLEVNLQTFLKPDWGECFICLYCTHTNSKSRHVRTLLLPLCEYSKCWEILLEAAVISASMYIHSCYKRL